nr:MAG TPA: hypothetical protein [Herelleviridae sp.]
MWYCQSTPWFPMIKGRFLLFHWLLVLSKYTLSVRLVQILILLVKLRFPLIWVLLCLILLIKYLLTVLLHNSI